MQRTDLNSRCVRTSAPVLLMFHCLYFFLEFDWKTQLRASAPAKLDWIRWLDAVNIPFIWFCIRLLISSSSVANWMHVTNCCFLLSKAGFCFWHFVSFFVGFLFLLFLFEHVDQRVLYEFVSTLFTHSNFISGSTRISRVKRGGGVLIFCWWILKGLLFCWHVTPQLVCNRLA